METRVRSARVIRTPAIVSGPASVNSRRNSLTVRTRSSSARTPGQRRDARIDRDQDLGDRVQDRHVQRRQHRAGVHDHHVVAGEPLEQPADAELAPLAQALRAAHLLRAGAQPIAGGDHVQPRVLRRHRDLVEPQAVQQRVGQPDGRRARGKNPSAALPEGSASISSTRRPSSSSAAARLIAVVLLPTPPFALVTATLRTSTPLPRRAAPGRSPAPNRGSTTSYRTGHGPSLSRFLASKVSRYPAASVPSRLDPKVRWKPGKSAPIHPLPMVPRPIGPSVPCPVGTKVPMWPGAMLPRDPSSTRNHGPHVDRDHAASDRRVPWDLVCLDSVSTWFTCDIDDQASSRPWCQGPRIPSDQGPDDSKSPMRTSRRRQLGTFISSATLVPRLDGSLVDRSQGPIAPTCRMRHDAEFTSLSRCSRHLVPCETSVPSRCIFKRCQGPSMKLDHGSCVLGLHGRPVVFDRLGPKVALDELAYTRRQWTGNTQVPCSLRHLGRNSNLISRRLLHQDDRVLMPRRSRGDRTTLEPSRRVAARRDGHLGYWVSRHPIGLGPRRSSRRGSLEPRVHSKPWAPSIPRDQGADEAGILGTNPFDRASRQRRQSAKFPCDPGAATGCMTMADGNQGTNAPGRPGSLVHLGPNITGPLAIRGAFDMLAAHAA